MENIIKKEEVEENEVKTRFIRQFENKVKFANELIENVVVIRLRRLIVFLENG